MKKALRIFLLVAAGLLALFFPQLAVWADQEFYVSLASRILIWGMFATSLNLLVGTGGMVSMGHAAFLGVGAYVVGIVTVEAPHLAGAVVVLPLAMLVAAALAFAIGAISLRTRGVYFIMITLAFAQMLFYIFISLKNYGGDDGMQLAVRSPLSDFNMADDTVFYYLVLTLLALCLFTIARLRASRFGRVLAGIKDNETRMASLGYATYRFKLIAFVIAGAMGGLAGALMANLNGYISPNMLYWDQSGTALVMVILGGLGSMWGGLVGASAFLLLEEVLTMFTSHWQIVLGLVMIGVVFWAPQGIAGMFGRRDER